MHRVSVVWRHNLAAYVADCDCGASELHLRLSEAEAWALNHEGATMTEQPEWLDAYAMRLELRIAAARTHIERLATIGHEPWKTPGHPMNQWVGRDAVNIAARRALDALDGEVQ